MLANFLLDIAAVLLTLLSPFPDLFFFTCATVTLLFTIYHYTVISTIHSILLHTCQVPNEMNSLWSKRKHNININTNFYNNNNDNKE